MASRPPCSTCNRGCCGRGRPGRLARVPRFFSSLSARSCQAPRRNFACGRIHKVRLDRTAASADHRYRKTLAAPGMLLLRIHPTRWNWKCCRSSRFLEPSRWRYQQWPPTCAMPTRLRRSAAALKACAIRDALPGASEATRALAGDLITTTLSAVGKQFSEIPRTAAEIEAYAEAMADMFCTYLKGLEE